MRRIAAVTLAISTLVGAVLAMPALAPAQPAQALGQKSPDPRPPALQPVPEPRQAPDGRTWSGEHRPRDWNRPYGKPVVRYGWTEKPLPPAYYAYPKWYRPAPVYVPGQWIWDGYSWVLIPGYWIY